MSVVNVCKDKLQSNVDQVLAASELAQKALDAGDYALCSQWLAECAKYCAFDRTLVAVFQAITDENKAKVLK